MPTRRTILAAAGTLGALGALGAYGCAAWPRLDAYEREAARQRRPLAADPGPEELIRMASLAANGHNAQPWLFRVGARGVSIEPDFSRRTPAVDPDDHHLFVSLGCAAENLALAAGRRAEVALRGGAGGAGNAGGAGAEIALGSGPAVPDPLAAAIPRRQSTRAPFDGRPLATEELRRLRATAREEGVAVELITAPAGREAFLELTTAGNAAQMADPAFIAELRDWIRFSPQEALARRDGLFSAAAGAPAAPAWLARRLFDLVFTVEAENDKYREHVRSAAGIAVFLGPAETPESWMRVGRSFQRFALQAAALDIRTAHLNQPVEVPALRGDLAALAGHPGRRPDLAVRFGRGPLLPMSLRRAPEAAMRPA